MTDETTGPETAEEVWDTRYRESGRIWSGEPNAAFVEVVGQLPAGRALDLGAGEGGDAVWLARRGWRVTAVDISTVALERAARHAAEAGVAERIDFLHHDLAVSFPEGSWDLVSAQFLHSMVEMPREEILRRAARAVAPGGVLLVEGHMGFPSWQHDHPQDLHFPTPEEVVESLRLPEGDWEVLRCEEHVRVQKDPEGVPRERTDATVLVRRL
ncbi:class I SAM-dependent methyltransferase [Streptomyces xiaopingdaonensis]|uniref:class I SAM-dependent methyltransferase n=1 Tax=Streptomyces xiaopingdaonensis TaxID=1565415 RepID=UPI0002D7F2BF|nr:class I SAM-dependent methyltransferase [Streptomyces xiaopingdaonensis]